MRRAPAPGATLGRRHAADEDEERIRLEFELLAVRLDDESAFEGFEAGAQAAAGDLNGNVGTVGQSYLGLVQSEHSSGTSIKHGGLTKAGNSATRFRLAGIVIEKKERTSARGNRFAFIQLSDTSGAFEVTAFSEVLGQARALLEVGQQLIVTEVRGPWVGCAIELGGKTEKGWVLAKSLVAAPVGDQKEEAEVYRGKPRDGTSHFHAYATAYVIRKGRRYTVALVPVRKGDAWDDVVRRLLREAARAGVRPKLLLLDRGFFAVSVVRYLQAARVPFLIQMPCRGRKPDHPKGPGGTQALCYQKRSGWFAYRWVRLVGP